MYTASIIVLPSSQLLQPRAQTCVRKDRVLHAHNKYFIQPLFLHELVLIPKS